MDWDDINFDGEGIPEGDRKRFGLDQPPDREMLLGLIEEDIHDQVTHDMGGISLEVAFRGLQEKGWPDVRIEALTAEVWAKVRQNPSLPKPSEPDPPSRKANLVKRSRKRPHN